MSTGNPILLTDIDWYDTGSLSVMPMRTIFVQTADGTAGNSTSETNLDSTGVGTKVIPANWFIAGRGLHVKANGIITNTATPNLTIKFKFNGTVMAATAANATVAITGTTNWYVDFLMTCRVAGLTSTSYSVGAFEYFSTGLVNAQYDMTDQGSAFSNAVTLTCGLTAAWGTSNASNTMTCKNLIVNAFGI